MRKRERLLLYKKLLKHYEEKNCYVMSSGLCHAVRCVSEYTTRLSDLPELIATKPKKPYSRGYWYTPGQTKGRITCLKKPSICVCKRNLVEGKNNNVHLFK